MTFIGPPCVMTIAGSDSGGGAGIQADLKTFAAFGVYGTSVLTAVTAQNTKEVNSVATIPVDVISSQFDTVISDIRVDVVKTGMLSSSPIVEMVAKKLKSSSIGFIVVDPVMVAASGARLLVDEAVEIMRRELIPLATVVTPNVPEATTLTGIEIETRDEMEEAARIIHGMGAKNVVIKGGHMKTDDYSVDLLFDGTKFSGYQAERINTKNIHGTGCTFASAIASGLSQGYSVNKSVSEAKSYVHKAILDAFPIGHGSGPLNHFHKWWPKELE